MQGLSKSIIVAAVVAFVTPALALAAASERAGAARKAQIKQESAARWQTAAAIYMSLVKQMQGNNDPALRAKLIRQQMQGGK